MPRRTTQTGSPRGARERVPMPTQLKLWVRAAAFCQFPGCHDYLLRDNLTLSETNFSNVAHIVAAKRDGPRGDHPMPLRERSHIENLMLLCRKHHTLIDSPDHRDEYPVDLLVGFKSEHEVRIRRLTAVGPKNKSVLVRLRSRIGTRAVEATPADLREAMFPLYPVDADGIEIDFSSEPEPTTPEQWQALADRIDQKVRQLHEPGVERPAAGSVSVFAFAPIPLLVHLGRAISDKVPTELFQPHRGTGGWRWIDDGPLATFTADRLQVGDAGSPVGLLLSVSGKVAVTDLPEPARRGALYEVRLESGHPSPTRIVTRADLRQFIRAYHEALARIRAEHPDVREVHLFAAVPIAAALACGHELIEKAHPSLVVYDFNKAGGCFARALKEN